MKNGSHNCRYCQCTLQNLKCWKTFQVIYQTYSTISIMTTRAILGYKLKIIIRIAQKWNRVQFTNLKYSRIFLIKWKLFNLLFSHVWAIFRYNFICIIYTCSIIYGLCNFRIYGNSNTCKTFSGGSSFWR